ncbi:(2Fe-2S)-binding protein [Chondromyces apiculatus]|uniref:(2Fe-2S)-binding protein n=1 Tax=Chondromyces apiculatus TaxID=51 RepID=UPI0005C52D9C|nr:(2Fe-2S)-binding protein [Chondromyces apiculatus]
MYVCLCKGVTDSEINDAICKGACSVTEVMRCTSAGTRCGSCRPTIQSLLEKAAPASAKRSLSLIPDPERPVEQPTAA